MISLWNTLTRAKESLGPADHTLRIYTCGPTVYNRVHVGNLRAFLFYDLLRRSLEWLGYSVRHVMNLTDVDDKTIRDSRREGTSLRAFTQRYTDLFHADLKKLRALPPHVEPRATDAIPRMISLIEDLLARGVAYKGDDGTVYFKIAAFPTYGRLSHLETRTLQAGARVAQDEYDKDSAQDFALWKAWTPDDGDVAWDAPFGRGRPGWHIECSALAFDHLGTETLDIHAGGVDLVFPHHENEIAQSEAATGHAFARLWVHNEHLLVGGEKMSKSKKNFFTLGDLETLGGATPREVRYALIASHYRSKLNLQVTFEGEGEARKPVRFDSVLDARGALRRFDQFRLALRTKPGVTPPEAGARLAQAKAEFRAGIADDLNTPRALAALFDLVGELNRLPGWDATFASEVEAFWADADRVLGVLAPDEAGLDAESQGLFDRWKAAREAKDFTAADSLRGELQKKGIGVQARKGSEPTWTKL